MDADIRLLNPEYLRFRIALLSADAEYVMTVGSPAHPILPMIDMRRYEELPMQVQDYCATEWSVRSEVIDIITDDKGIGLVLARVPDLSRMKGPFPSRQYRVSDLHSPLVSMLERTVLQKLRSSGVTGRGPFSYLTWMDDVRKWLSEILHIGPDDLTITQRHMAPHRTLLNVVVPAGQQYWVKGGPQLERSLMEFLSEELPRFVPEFLGHHPTLGVCLMAHAGDSLSTSDTISDREIWQVSALFARFQCRTSTLNRQLRALQPRLLSTRDIVRGLEDQFRRCDELFAGDALVLRPQQASGPLERIVSILEEVASRLTNLQLPEVLLHDDLHSGNILGGGGDYAFADWEDARLGTPFESIEYLSLLNPNQRRMEPVVSAYLSVWGSVLAAEVIQPAIRLARPLTIAARLFCLLQRSDEMSNSPSQHLGPSVRILIRQLENSLTALNYGYDQGSVSLPPNPVTRSI